MALTFTQVFVITGANSGVGFELAKILYTANAKVYLAGRSEKRVLEAIRLIRDEIPLSQGNLVWLPLDLSDLASVKMAAEEFLSKEERLDILWNNAGVMCTPTTDKSEQVTPPDSVCLKGGLAFLIGLHLTSIDFRFVGL